MGIISKSAPVSVLMSTYACEKTTRLAMALESLVIQSAVPKEVILVVDGPIDEEQEEIIQKYTDKNEPFIFTVLRLQRNSGLATALNFGIPFCSFDLIARMDSDDISREDRIEKQFQFLQQHPNVDVVASWQAEFEDDDTDRITTVKQTPADHETIVRLLKWRNVISHPTIMLRKSSLLSINGYDETVGLLEDYDLHMRLIHSGARYAVIQEPLVKVRISRSQRSRRGGLSYLMREGVFRYRCYKRGNYTLMVLITSFTASAFFRIMPPSIKRSMYRFVRSPIKKEE